MRILGLDYGDKTIGIAVSDPLLITAFGVSIIRREDPNSFKKPLVKLREVVKEYQIERIVLGYPINLDNTEGERCIKTKDFKERLERNFKKIPIILWDERLSTSFARMGLREANLTSAKIDNVIDKMAAVYILQGYLEYIKKNEVDLT